MREHQIVITLKPEQFLEVQRLARAANAKSMGMFVRQKLLAALGIEGSLGPASAGQSQLSPQAVSQIVNELHRLHGELKGFVSDSVAHYSLEPERAGSQEQKPGGGTDVTGDDFEELAGRTFAISPRLGQLESPPVVPDAAMTDPLETALPLRDPLEALLSGEAMPRLSKPEKQFLGDEDDEEEEYIPLSLRQKRSEKANQPAKPMQESATESPPEELDAVDQNSAAEEEKLDQPDRLEKPAEKAQDSAAPPASSGGNTPFSGGPPPKRRRE